MKTLAEHIADLNAKTQAWVAEDPTNRFAGTLTDDLEHWASYGIHTAAELDKYLAYADFVETYKAVNGIKPRWIDYDAVTIQDLQAEMERLIAYQNAEAEEEAAIDQWVESLTAYKPSNAMAEAFAQAQGA